ncbi:cytidine deaminase [Bradyrhizobium sp. BR 10289]|nr:cytidine deaminase [Bradyrhizobium sp. BR 10289]
MSPPELVARARQALGFAYARYSNFAVAAAVIDERGRLFQGVNVENASYGLTICAERAAIFSAVSQGARRITAIAITAEKTKALEPCGACRQVMLEFCEPGTRVFLDTGTNEPIERTVGELMPHAFTLKDVPV